MQMWESPTLARKREDTSYAREDYIGEHELYIQNVGRTFVSILKRPRKGFILFSVCTEQRSCFEFIYV